MLSQTFKELERDQLVLRKEYLEVPVRVEYELSEQAKKLQPILIQLIQWRMNTSNDLGTNFAHMTQSCDLFRLPV